MVKNDSKKEIKKKILIITAKKRKSFSVSELLKELKGETKEISRPTLEKYIKELIKDGWLEEIENKNGKED